LGGFDVRMIFQRVLDAIVEAHRLDTLSVSKGADSQQEAGE